MIWYIVIYIIVGLYVFSDKYLQTQHQKKIALFVMLGFLFFMSGTRFELAGSDYYIYKQGYEAIPKLWELSRMREAINGIRLVEAFETGFLLFCSLLKTLGLSFYGFMVVEAAIWYSCMYFGLKRYVKDWTLVIPIFMYKLFFYDTFISLRQSLTIALFFLSLKLIEEKKIILYYAICLLSLSMHNAAILMFIIYPVFRLKLDKKRLFLYNAVCWPIYLFGLLGVNIYSVIGKVLEYLPVNNLLVYKATLWINFTEGISFLHVAEYAFLMLLLLVFYEESKDDGISDIALKMFVIILPLFTIFGANVVATRFKDYFTISYAMVLEYLCSRKGGRYESLIKVATYIICGAGFFRYIIVFDEGTLMPYRSFIFENMPFFR